MSNTQSAADKAAEAAAKAAAEQAEESPSGVQGNLGAPDPTKETPPVASDDTPAKPAASGNPTDVLGPSDSGPNQMSTAGLTITQRARVEGSPVQGNLAAPGQTGANEALAAGARFGGKYNKDGSVKASFRKDADEAEAKRTGKK